MDVPSLHSGLLESVVIVRSESLPTSAHVILLNMPYSQMKAALVSACNRARCLVPLLYLMSDSHHEIEKSRLHCSDNLPLGIWTICSHHDLKESYAQSVQMSPNCLSINCTCWEFL